MLEVDAALGLEDAAAFDAGVGAEVGGRPESLSADCSCRLEARTSSRTPWALLSLFGLVLVRRRRRAREASFRSR